MAAITWDTKAEIHNNLVVFHTRTDRVRDWLEDNTDAKCSMGTAYVDVVEKLETIKAGLQTAGFVVG